jgi:pimeloyl-ACP methyl ester carboxylesterase
MHGKRDRIVPANYARVIAEHIPGSQLLLLDAGHAAHIRCEKEYTEAIMNFFNGPEP